MPRKVDFDIFEERLPWEADGDPPETLVEPATAAHGSADPQGQDWAEAEASAAPALAPPADLTDWELEPETWTAQPPTRTRSRLPRNKLVPAGAAGVLLLTVGALALGASHGPRRAPVHAAARTSKTSSGPGKAVVLAAAPAAKGPGRSPKTPQRSRPRPRPSVRHAASAAPQPDETAAPTPAEAISPQSSSSPVEKTAPASEPAAPVTAASSSAPVAVPASSQATAAAAPRSSGSSEFSFER